MKARRDVANGVAPRAKTSGFSAAQASHLEHARVMEPPTASEVEELERVLSSAQDERPLQSFLERFPHLLGTVLSGAHAQYVLPSVRLGAERVPDFLVADVDSAGIRWVLVELESPRSPVTLRTKNQLSDKARTGVSQIQEWREWIQNNLDYARRPRNHDGLGLIDIRPAAEGLVLVGRREELRPSASSLRRQLYETESISIHTYDWLIERLMKACGFRGVDSLRL